MPPITRFDRQAVLAAALELTRKDGLDALNARAVAREMGSSTQPIFRLFSGMDDLKEHVIALVQDEWLQFAQSYATAFDSRFMSNAFAYVMFARYHSELFKILFMVDRIVDTPFCIPQFEFKEEHIQDMQDLLGYEREKAICAMHWFWTFTHGLAVSFATKYCTYTDEHTHVILSSAVETVRQQMDRLLS